LQRQVNTQTSSTAQVGNKLITVGVNDLTLGPYHDYNIHIKQRRKWVNK
jgi:hypothetical protein